MQVGWSWTSNGHTNHNYCTGMGKLRPAGHVRPTMGLSAARGSLQQIRKRINRFLFKLLETLFPLKCLCWIMNVLAFINHTACILHYLKVHHTVLIGAALWRFMAHWYGPRPENFTHLWHRTMPVLRNTCCIAFYITYVMKLMGVVLYGIL